VTPPIIAVVGLLALYSGGGSITLEGPA
jgi:xanthosine utilization system XapX-like protein